MTYQEAIKVLLELHDQCCQADNIFCTDASAVRVEALDAAVSALEKQIPKKPVVGYVFAKELREVIKRTDPKRAESKTECCPICGRPLGVSQYVKAQTGLRFGDPHCKRCGQAIDWGDE